MHKLILDDSYADAIVNSVREALVVLDENLHVVTANRSFYKIFHTSKADTENKLFSLLGNGQWNNPKLLHLLKKIIPQKSFFQDFEIEFDFPHIGKRVMIINGRKIIQKNAPTPLILVAIDDITEKKKLEQQKDDFISIASHELKTPVTSLKIYAQLLEKHPLLTNDKRAAEMLAKMHVQMNRLTNLVASFMNVYKMGTQKLRLHKTRFELEDLVTEVIANFQYTISSHHVEQHLDTKVEVFADRDRINQVLVNLISNAIKYSPDTDRVVIRLSKDKDKAIVSVQDFGSGIPPEEQSRIYERFFRAKGRKDGKIPGLGLGLFISAEIIKQHNSILWVDSQVNKGSTFYFSLPIVKREAQTG